MADTKISALTELLALKIADVFPLVDDPAGTPVTKKMTIGTLLGIGWIGLGACTYEGADAPNYTVSFASDMTAILKPGDKIKLTDSTVKYFIIMAVGAYSGGKTIITIFGGTDYTLSGGAITLPYFSIQKSPFGFPMNPDKWTVETTDVSNRQQASPTDATWYNPTACTIAIPIGLWTVQYHACLFAYKAAGYYQLQAMATLSTANNSESDAAMSSSITTGGPSATGIGTVRGMVSRRKTLSLASKATYYLNCKNYTGSADAVGFSNDVANLSIKAICAYL